MIKWTSPTQHWLFAFSHFPPLGKKKTISFPTHQSTVCTFSSFCADQTWSPMSQGGKWHLHGAALWQILFYKTFEKWVSISFVIPWWQYWIQNTKPIAICGKCRKLVLLGLRHPPKPNPKRDFHESFTTWGCVGFSRLELDQLWTFPLYLLYKQDTFEMERIWFLWPLKQITT